MKSSNRFYMPLLFSALFIMNAEPICAAQEKSSSIIIADFNRDSLNNNLYGESGTWEKNPDDDKQWVSASLDNVVRLGESGASLKIEYNAASPKSVNGFWTQLKAFDASKYDHLEFWVKGDERKKFTTTFKIEFKKNQKLDNAEEETITGSYIVKGVTGNWQKVSIPLNVMNGISDWKDIREMVITLEEARVDSPAGVLYFDDFAFVNTGNPGPNARDVVAHKKKKTEKDLSPEDFARFLISR
ncbi:MAG: hypothetical protein Q7S07_01495, partial [Candidatus Omnitrophota bacterium]|nr:hypothetical protein [Candidatus Omnitrophota bacterium]